MNRRTILVVALLVIAGLFLLLEHAVMAQVDFCEGNFDYDADVDGSDASRFKEDFGRSTFLNPCPGGFAAVQKTGQTTSYATGDDGNLEKGVAWPNPRFTIIYCDTTGPCSNQEFDCDTDAGTDVVTDNLTGLLWTRDANMFGLKTWQQALDLCNSMNHAGYDDWRLPNRFELASLLDIKFYQPALSNSMGTGQWTHGDPFINLITDGNYWSSSTCAYSLPDAWLVYMYFGIVGIAEKDVDHYFWPVRGGH